MSIVFDKPKINKFQERKEKVLKLLMDSEFVTKPKIAELLEWQYPKSDRQIRMIIEDISHTYPIISTSDTNKGYKLAKSIDDAEHVKHSWAEIDSRIHELSKRKKPLVKFMDKHGIRITLF